MESVYRVCIENLVKEVRKELLEDYVLFHKVKSYYVKNGASGTTIYTKLTRLRFACWLAEDCLESSLESSPKMYGKHYL